VEVQAEESGARSLDSHVAHELAVPIEHDQPTERTRWRGWIKRCHIDVALLIRGDALWIRATRGQCGERFYFTAIPRGGLKREQHKGGQQGNTKKAKQMHLDTHPFVFDWKKRPLLFI
jgi:hypothetical protein